MNLPLLTKGNNTFLKVKFRLMSPEYGNKSFLFVYIWHQLCFVLAIVIPFHKEDLSINQSINQSISQSINQSLVSLINTQFLSKAFHLTKIVMVINFHILLTRISSKCFLQIKSSKCKSGKHFPNMKVEYLSIGLVIPSILFW